MKRLPIIFALALGFGLANLPPPQSPVYARRADDKLAVKADVPVVTLPATINVERGDIFTIDPTTTQATVVWYVLDSGGFAQLPPSILKDGLKSFVGIAKKGGSFRVLAVVAQGGVPSQPAVCTVTIADPNPPVPPVPPGPGPGPTPGPAPIPVDGFRVLIVYETADVAKMPAAQQSVLFSASVRAYLNAKCAKGPGGTAEARIWDKDVDAAGDSPLWGAAMKRPRQSLPWLIVSTGKAGFEGPLPANVDDTLKLLKQYGGE